jgi:hypothetical protein
MWGELRASLRISSQILITISFLTGQPYPGGGISVGFTFQPLQQQFRNIHYLVIDEQSIIGQIQMGWIDRRLCQVFPERREETFGGLGVLIIGDFFQLPPVGQASLFSMCSTHACELAHVGRLAYKSINHTAVLTQAMRQSSDDEQSIAFQTALK